MNQDTQNIGIMQYGRPIQSSETQYTRDREHQQRIVHHLSHQALSGLPIEQLFQLTADAIRQVIPQATAGVWQLLSDGCTAQEIANTHPQQALRVVNTRATPIIETLFQRNQPLTVSPQLNTEVLMFCSPDTQYGVHLPIYGSRQCFGLLAVYTSEPAAFDNTEQLFLQSITHLLATAIERQRSAALLNVQTHVLESVAAGSKLSQVLNSLCLLIEEQSPGAISSVLLVSETGDCLQAGAGPSVPTQFVEGIDGLKICEGGGSCGTAAFRGEAVFASDIATDPIWHDYRDFALSHEIRAAWSMPFFAQSGAVLGTFALSHRIPCEPTDHHVQILKTASHLASIAVESHRNTTKLQHQARYDPLTGLPNRVLFAEQLEHCCQYPQDSGFAILVLDIDHFKLVNDSFGHTVGDQLLVAFVNRLQRCLREEDCFARLSGDEFAILLKDVPTVQDAQAIAHCIQTNLQKTLTLDAHQMFVSVSIGIVPVHQMGHQPVDLLRDADTAMYQAKSQSRGSVAVFSPQMHTQARQRLQLANHLRQAIDHLTLGEDCPFALHYQPIVKLQTGAIAGFEALIRWQHSEQGLISPARFIPLAEETGLILPLGRWILQAACQQWQQWQHQLAQPQHLMMSVNVSSRQLIQPDFLGQIRQVLTDTAIPPHCLKLEITETMLMETSRYITQVLNDLRALGVHLSLDDFGTGYSSLSYLHQFPIQTLKVDRSFVADLSSTHDPIVQSILALAQGLGIDAIAEGIETTHQQQLLKTMGCGYGQGYLFSRPVCAEQALQLLKQGKLAW